MSKIDLSGIWSLSCSKEGVRPIPATIPGENCSALIAEGIVPEPYIGLNEKEIQWVRDYDWTWTRKFEVNAQFMTQERIWLNIDSLDTAGEIRINGKLAASGRNMFSRLRQDVKDFLHEGENTIEVFITAVDKYVAKEAEKLTIPIGITPGYGRCVGNINLIRKIQSQGGWDWGACIPVSGMYGNV
ncbi:MAG: glycoside hydrolase family 2 protein, partial [Lentisphaeria bacterium]|nr:glycoside hydrolase family 2 protein [Lentisphaeria bacterium]